MGSGGPGKNSKHMWVCGWVWCYYYFYYYYYNYYYY